MKRNLPYIILALCISAILSDKTTIIAQEIQLQKSTTEPSSQLVDINIQDDYKYKVLDNGTIEITHYTGTDAHLVIPNKIDGKKVTRLGDSSFAECKNLISVNIPDSVTTLLDYTFSYCDNLENVTLPSSIARIGEHAFSGCKNLKEIVLPDNVQNIGWRTFASCSSLKDITFPKNLKTIDMEAFDSCESLTNISFPEGTWYIGESAFSGCNNLASIEFPKSITDISKSAFAECTNLKNIYYTGNKATRKKCHVFGRGNEYMLRAKIHYRNSGHTETFAPLKGAILKSGQESYKVKTNISTVAFTKTTNNGSKLTVPGHIEVNGIFYDVESVSANAFKNNKNITKVTIEGYISSIGTNAFNGCSKLKTVVIKSDILKSVGQDAFYGTTESIKVKVPFNQSTRYKKLLKNSGLGKKAMVIEI